MKIRAEAPSPAPSPAPAPAVDPQQPRAAGKAVLAIAASPSASATTPAPAPAQPGGKNSVFPGPSARPKGSPVAASVWFRDSGVDTGNPRNITNLVETYDSLLDFRVRAGLGEASLGSMADHFRQECVNSASRALSRTVMNSVFYGIR